MHKLKLAALALCVALALGGTAQAMTINPLWLHRHATVHTSRGAFRERVLRLAITQRGCFDHGRRVHVRDINRRSANDGRRGWANARAVGACDQD